MMNKDFARKAVIDDILWESICHLRGIYTSMRDVDYTPDVCKRLQLIPIETFFLTSSLKKHVFYNWLINTILYLCVI